MIDSPLPLRHTLLCLILMTLAGCGDGLPGALSTSRTWELVVDIDGTQVKIPLDVMNVYLVEDVAYPETFEILGDGVSLVGKFPIDLHVGYEEDWQKLIDHEITISDSYEGYREIRSSTIILPGREPMTVLGGTLVFDSVTGKYAGRDGDITLAGEVTLRVKTPSGQVDLKGTIAVHGVSWG